MKNSIKALAALAAVFVLAATGCASMAAGWALDEAKAQAKNGNYDVAVAKTLESIKGSEGKNADAVAYLPAVAAEGDAYYNDILAKNPDPYAQFNALAGLVAMNGAIKSSGTTAVAAKDYSAQFAAAQKAAGELAYGDGKSALKGGTTADGRKAFASFSNVEAIYRGSASPFADLAALKAASYELGLVRVIVVIPDEKAFGQLVAGGTPDLVSATFAGMLAVPGDAAWTKIESGFDALVKYKSWADGSGSKYVTGKTAAGVPLIGASQGKQAFAASVDADLLVYGLLGDVKVSFSDQEKNAKAKATITTGEGKKYDIDIASDKLVCTLLSDTEFYAIGKSLVAQMGGSGGVTGLYWSASYKVSDNNIIPQSRMALTDDPVFEREGKLFSFPDNGVGILVGGPTVSAAEAASQKKILQDGIDQWKAHYPAELFLKRMSALADSVNRHIAQYVAKI